MALYSVRDPAVLVSNKGTPFRARLIDVPPLKVAGIDNPRGVLVHHFSTMDMA